MVKCDVLINKWPRSRFIIREGAPRLDGGGMGPTQQLAVAPLPLNMSPGASAAGLLNNILAWLLVFSFLLLPGKRHKVCVCACACMIVG